MPRRPRRTARALLALLALGFGASCLGAIVGTGIDTVGSALTYPFREWLFAGRYEHDNDWDDPWQQLEDDRERDFGNELVGLAVSGGGSRSAYFLACVLDQLRTVPATRQGGSPAAGATSLLDEIDFISSVSGGSLASAYYALHRPDTSDPATLDAFFERFRKHLRSDYELRSVSRILFEGRIFPLVLTHYNRGHVLAGVWDDQFFGDATFADLPPPRPPHPTLIINATSYSRGSKFLFTRLPTARFNDSRLMHGLRDLRLVTGGYTELHRPFENIGFDTLASDIGRFPLSHAVAASAGVPGIVGPTVLRNRSQPDVEAYEQLGDGGLYDNYGLETLVQLFGTMLEEKPGLHARIIVVDASSFFDAQDGREEYTIADYADRVTSIAWLRTADYTDLLYANLKYLDPKRMERRQEGLPLTDKPDSPYRNLSLDLVSLYHGAAEAKPQAQPRSGSKLYRRIVPAAIRDPAAFASKLGRQVRAIGMRFSLSDEHAQVIEQEAELAVREVLAPPSAP